MTILHHFRQRHLCSPLQTTDPLIRCYIHAGAATVLTGSFVNTAGSGHLAGGLVAVLSTRIMTSHGPAGWCSHWRACFKAAWMRSIIPCWEYYGRLKKSRKCQLQWAHRQPWIRIASVYVCMVIYRDILGSCAATSGGIATLALTTGGACVSLLLYSWDQTQGKVDIKERKPLGHGMCHTFVMGIPYKLSSSSTLNLLGRVLKQIFHNYFHCFKSVLICRYKPGVIAPAARYLILRHKALSSAAAG